MMLSVAPRGSRDRECGRTVGVGLKRRRGSYARGCASSGPTQAQTRAPRAMSLKKKGDAIRSTSPKIEAGEKTMCRQDLTGKRKFALILLSLPTSPNLRSLPIWRDRSLLLEFAPSLSYYVEMNSSEQAKNCAFDVAGSRSDDRLDLLRVFVGAIAEPMFRRFFVSHTHEEERWMRRVTASRRAPASCSRMLFCLDSRFRHRKSIRRQICLT